jgi:hypothetical protein
MPDVEAFSSSQLVPRSEVTLVAIRELGPIGVTCPTIRDADLVDSGTPCRLRQILERADIALRVQ